MTPTGTGATALDALIAALRTKAQFNKNEQEAPALVLWPDQEREWEPLLPLLRESLPALLTLGPYQKALKTGPAIWVRCMVARTLDEVDWPADQVPIFYLPGVSRAQLRAVESCPRALQPLAALQYRGEYWTQLNGKDWTVYAFLKSKDGGLGLDVAPDADTRAAVARALKALATTPVEELRGHHLEAAHFDALLSGDPVRDVLQWLNAPTVVRERWGEERWRAFRSVCQREYGLDPESAGELHGAESLGEAKSPPWQRVCERYEESPTLYPNIPAILDQAAPRELFTSGPHWPKVNVQAEAGLREALRQLANLPAPAATIAIRQLEEKHSERRQWVWRKLGKAPLAEALHHLACLANMTATVPAVSSVMAIAGHYEHSLWEADAAVLDALRCVARDEDVAVVGGAIRALYEHWLDELTLLVQKRVAEEGYAAPPHSDELPPGTCVLFADGLRLDLGKCLAERLKGRDLSVQVDTTWAALPSVTATSKPGVSPVAHLVAGLPDAADFEPIVAASGKPLNPYNFRKLLEENGWRALDTDECGNPDGRAWSEYGALDHYGHEHGWKLAWRVEEELAGLADRIESLLRAGWARIRVMTDHGWLLLPGGLPKKEMPAYLAKSRWGRCAVLKDDAQYPGTVMPWRWCPQLRVAMPPGIGVFFAGQEYSHGGLSLQECVTPILTVTSAAPTARSKLEKPVWRGLRCRVTVVDAEEGMVVDLRTRTADTTSSIACGGKEIPLDGKLSLLVEDEHLEGTAGNLVLIDARGRIVDRLLTTVGENE